VIHEYEVPGGALNLSPTKLPRPWSPWESSPSRKNSHGYYQAMFVCKCVLLPMGVNPIPVQYISYHTISHHISHHIIPNHTIYHNIPYHITPYHIIYNTISHHISYHTIYHIIPYHISVLRGRNNRCRDILLQSALNASKDYPVCTVRRCHDIETRSLWRNTKCGNTMHEI
jgi:hypothetical protein